MALFDVGGEVVEQVIDNLGSEDLDSFVLGELLGLRGDTNIEGQDSCVLLLYLRLVFDSQYLGCLQNILLVDWSDRNAANRNLGGQKELKECLHRSKGGGLDADTVLGLVDVLVEDVIQVVSDLLSRLLDFGLVLRAEELRTGDGVLEPRGGDLDTHSALDFLMMEILSFDSHFLHWIWGQKGSDLGDDRPVETLQHDCVLDFQETVHKEHIDRGSKTFDDLHLEHRALKLVFLLELLGDSGLA